jgi:hypothetical protein
VAKKYFGPRNRTVGVLIPDGESEEKTEKKE